MAGESGTPYLPEQAHAPAVARQDPQLLFTPPPITLAELLAETAPSPPKQRRSVSALLQRLGVRRRRFRALGIDGH